MNPILLMALSALATALPTAYLNEKAAKKGRNQQREQHDSDIMLDARSRKTGIERDVAGMKGMVRTHTLAGGISEGTYEAMIDKSKDLAFSKISTSAKASLLGPEKSTGFWGWLL